MWIELHTTLTNHPKIEALSTELNIKKNEAIGYVCCLWLWCMQYAEDGDISKYSPEVIERACFWEGTNQELFRKLVGKRGFIDENMLIHDWLDYAGPFLIKKYHTSNLPKLKAIWKKHGYVYGRRSNRKYLGSKKEANSNSTLPNQPYLPNHTNPIIVGQAKNILKHLNLKSKTPFQENDTNLGFIVARLKEKGVTEEICVAIIDHKTYQWLEKPTQEGVDPTMAEFLRPATLFNKTKFWQYHGQVIVYMEKQVEKDLVKKRYQQDSERDPTPEEIKRGEEFEEKLKRLKNV